jgi:glycosyltransferase involved in cell wall biosynthesis
VRVDEQPDVKDPGPAQAGRPLRVMQVMGGLIRSGVDSVVLTLAEGMRPMGVETVFAPLGEGRLAREARALGFMVDSLAKKRRYDVLSFHRLAGLIRKHRVDLVNSHELNGAFYAAPAARLAGVAHVNSYHLDVRESLKLVYRRQAAIRASYRTYLFLMRWCDRVIAIAPSIQQDVVAGGVSRDKVVFIPTAIDLEPYDPGCPERERIRAELDLPAGATVIGAACRLQQIKNLPLLLQAAGRLVRDGEDLRVVIAGEGNERRGLERLTAELGLDGRVRFTGFRGDLPAVMSAYDIFALPSKGEGIPIAILEAMALGKPVVATDVGGVSACVEHGRTGLLVPSGDVDGFTEALRVLMKDGEQARRFGAAGRLRVEREFARPIMVGRTLNLYRNVLASRSPAWK